jgi:peptidoglycan/xylan/chitin deacetylase (PgdA/CDA1 family)
MIHVSWNVDSLDWQDPNPASVQKRVEQQMAANGRGIILFHDIHTPGLTVVPNLVAKNKGKVRWVDIPHIVNELNGVKR